jgi:AcrR family transcriptional regulator
MVRTQSNERRERILQVAAEVFAREGYHRATIADIITGADIARGTFYLYFKSKQDVFEFMADRFLAQLKGGIKGIDLEGEIPALAQLEANLVRTIETVRQYRNVAAIMFGGNDAPDPRIRDKVELFFAEVKELVAGSIVTGQMMGLVRDVSPELAARFMFGAAREAMRDMVALRPESDDTDSFLELSASLVDLVACGLFRPPDQCGAEKN